jgi:hypothetical protein
MPVKIANPRGKPDNAPNNVAQITQMVWMVVGFLEGVLATRLLLQALDTSGTSGFAEMVLAFTMPFVTPFLRIFPSAGADPSQLETASMVAMAAYLLLGAAVIKIVRRFYAAPRPAI